MTQNGNQQKQPAESVILTPPAEPAAAETLAKPAPTAASRALELIEERNKNLMNREMLCTPNVLVSDMSSEEDHRNNTRKAMATVIVRDEASPIAAITLAFMSEPNPDEPSRRHTVTKVTFALKKTSERFPDTHIQAFNRTILKKKLKGDYPDCDVLLVNEAMGEKRIQLISSVMTSISPDHESFVKKNTNYRVATYQYMLPSSLRLTDLVDTGQLDPSTHALTSAISKVFVVKHYLDKGTGQQIAALKKEPLLAQELKRMETASKNRE